MNDMELAHFFGSVEEISSEIMIWARNGGRDRHPYVLRLSMPGDTLSLSDVGHIEWKIVAEMVLQFVQIR